MTVDGATVVVVSAGYHQKRSIHARMAELGARLVMIDEPGHWSESLVAEGIAAQWLPVVVTGDPDVDARAVLSAIRDAGVRPDAVLTFWEDSAATTARVAAALGLPTNPPEAVDRARSKACTREESARHGLPTPQSHRTRSVDELFAAAGVIGFPLVLKPEYGASAIGCLKVERMDDLAEAFAVVSTVVTPETDEIFRAGVGLLVEEYLDGVEFDIDLVMHDGECAFSSVSQNWPTLEPSFQETGLHCPPDHDPTQVARLVDLCVATAQAFGLHRGVLHIEGKCTSRGPRVVEVNARMGGGRVYEFVKAVWGVDLVEAQLRSALGLSPNLRPATRPKAAAVNRLLYADESGTLVDLPLDASPRAGVQAVILDPSAEAGDTVLGPDQVFASLLVEATVIATDLRTARAAMADVLRERPRIVPAGSSVDRLRV